jgi:hypothetical protein
MARVHALLNQKVSAGTSTPCAHATVRISSFRGCGSRQGTCDRYSNDCTLRSVPLAKGQRFARWFQNAMS